MNNLNQFKGTELVWKQPKLGVEQYQLLNGKEVYGDLYWTKWVSDKAVGKSYGIRWSFDRVLFLRSKVVVTELKTRLKVAEFEFDWAKGGTIRLISGASYLWSRKDLIRNIWVLTDMDEEQLFEMELNLRWLKNEALVTLQTTPEKTNDLDLILLMCMYLAFCAIKDMSGSTEAETPVNN